MAQPVNGLSLTAIAIRRHIGTLMLTLAILVVGVFSLAQLPVDLLPAITYPRIEVRVDVPGVSPGVLVEEVTKPLEQAMSATSGVVQIYSSTREGRSRVTLYFRAGANLDRALSEATASLNRIRGQLPATADEPRLFPADPGASPIFEFALQSESLSLVELRRFAEENLARELSYVPGTATVDVAGGIQEEIRVSLDLDRLQAFGLNLNAVLGALRDRNIDTPGGRLGGAAGEPVTRTTGRFQSINEIANISLPHPTRAVNLREVGDIRETTAEQRVFVTLNGLPAVKVSILKQPEANTIRLIDELKQRLDDLQVQGLVPADMILAVTYDESKFIRQALINVANAGFLGTGLAALVVLLFLGSLRQTLIIAIAIPLATLCAIILMQLLGLSLNVFSLGGLALGVGIVVDNAIVMLETITVAMADSSAITQKDRLEAGITGAQSVESALVASTATNLVVVLPFLLVGGIFALLFGELILTVSLAVAASLVLALTIVPMLTTRLLAVPSGKFSLAQFPPLKAFRSGITQLTRLYHWVLTKIIRVRLLFIPIVLVALILTSWQQLQELPLEILPPINTGQAFMIGRFRPGVDLATNLRLTEIAADIVLDQPETENAFVVSGGFLFSNATIENLLRSSGSITLKPGTSVDQFTETISQEFKQRPSAQGNFFIFPSRLQGLRVNNSPVGNADLDLVLQSEDPELLEETGTRILERLNDQAALSRFRPDSRSRSIETTILPNWERLGELGLTANDLGTTVQSALSGNVPTQLQRQERLIDVRVQLNNPRDQDMASLEELPLISAASAAPIRLGDVASLGTQIVPGEINRINQRSVYILIGNLVEGAVLSDAIAEVEEIMSTLQLPPGVVIQPSYAQQSSAELRRSLGILGGLAIFLVLVIMALQYNSLVDPLVILVTVPLALSGGIYGLTWTKTPISATVLIGAVLLVGIVVNNGIVMVELANQRRQEQSLSRQQAIVQAATQRLRPILMTALTTILGLLPLALGSGEGSEFLQPLGIVVFSGLLVATCLTLFVVPCVYVILHELFAGKFWINNFRFRSRTL
ncbi:MAG: efflux RND transporter permease subunit [Cyanobacteria bacterium P01_H01_bin.15]